MQENNRLLGKPLNRRYGLCIVVVRGLPDNENRITMLGSCSCVLKKRGRQMRVETLEDLVKRQKLGEIGVRSQILERIAADVYGRPRVYGCKSEDDVGEIFERYWTRINGLVDRYEDRGSGFESFVISSIRYMALSVRRKNACCYDREGVYKDAVKAEINADTEDASESSLPQHHRRSIPGFPRPEDKGICAVAFRRRMLFICLKCANLIDDGDAERIASSVGLDIDALLDALKKARDKGLGLRLRTSIRRRGRDAAWLRMGASARRLSREVDEDIRSGLSHAIDKDRGLYTRAIHHIAKATPILSNKAVAELLDVPKGTVDCGVRRLMHQYGALYSDEHT